MEKKYAFEHVGKYKGYQFIKIINGGIVWSYNECWMPCVFDTVETAKYFIDSTKKFMDNFANVISDAQKVAIEKNKGYVSVDIVNQFIKKDTTMKKIIKTDKVTIFAVKILGEISSCHLNSSTGNERILRCNYTDNSELSIKTSNVVLVLPIGSHWKVINSLSKINEEQANELVEKVMEGQHYLNYFHLSMTDRWVKTAKESFYSLMTKNGVFLENPIEKPTMEKFGYVAADHQESEPGWVYEEGEEKYNEALAKWKEVEDNSGEWVILKEVK